jgi:hypothetical protein
MNLVELYPDMDRMERIIALGLGHFEFEVKVCYWIYVSEARRGA